MADHARRIVVTDPITGEAVEEFVRVARCGKCKQEIIWATTPRGRKMPLDPQPDPDRGLVQLNEAHDQVIRVWPEWRAAALRGGGMTLFNAHFDTCPKWEKRRRRQRAKAPPPDPIVPREAPKPRDPQQQLDLGGSDG